MKYLPYFFFLGLIYAGQLSAQRNNKTNKNLIMSASIGYTQQNFNWSIAGDNEGRGPNILSELKWKNIAGTLFNMEAVYKFSENIYISMGYSRAYTGSGTATDTDYEGDHRTNPKFTAVLNSSEGGTSELKLGIGYRFAADSPWSVDTRAGYSIYRGIFTLTDIEQAAEDEQLNAEYKTDWRGVYMRIYPAVRIREKIELSCGVEYNQAGYNAAADWNLIEQFQHPVSFRHRANGYGLLGGWELNYHLNRKSAVGLNAAWFIRETGIGVDRLFLKSGEIRTTRFNGARQSGGYISVAGRLAL